MDGIEKITARIRADADAELVQLREQTEAQILEIQTQSKAQADQERTAILARGRRAAEERLERLKSAAQLERRKLELAAKQEVLSEAFEQALEKPCALPEEEYIQLLTGMVLQAVSTGREQLVFSPRDRSRIGKQVVVAANEALVKEVAPELPDSLTDSRVGALLGKVVNSAATQITGTGLLLCPRRPGPSGAASSWWTARWKSTAPLRRCSAFSGRSWRSRRRRSCLEIENEELGIGCHLRMLMWHKISETRLV